MTSLLLTILGQLLLGFAWAAFGYLLGSSRPRPRLPTPPEEHYDSVPPGEPANDTQRDPDPPAVAQDVVGPDDVA